MDITGHRRVLCGDPVDLVIQLIDVGQTTDRIGVETQLFDKLSHPSVTAAGDATLTSPARAETIFSTALSRGVRERAVSRYAVRLEKRPIGSFLPDRDRHGAMPTHLERRIRDLGQQVVGSHQAPMLLDQVHCPEPATSLLVGDGCEQEVATRLLVPGQIGANGGRHRCGDVQHVHRTPPIDESVLDLGGEGVPRITLRVGRDDVQVWGQGKRWCLRVESRHPIYQRLSAGTGSNTSPAAPMKSTRVLTERASMTAMG